MTMTHITWSIESPIGKCPYCGGNTVLVSCAALWRVDEASAIEALGQAFASGLEYDAVYVGEEITGHYCVECFRLTSLSLNTGG